MSHRFMSKVFRVSSRALHLLKEERVELLELQKTRSLRRGDKAGAMFEDCKVG